MFGWFSRPTSPSIKSLERRLDDLQADLEHLAEQHRKLRGRVTGAIRHETAAQEPAGEASGPQLVPGVPPTPDRVQAAFQRMKARSF